MSVSFDRLADADMTWQYTVYDITGRQLMDGTLNNRKFDLSSMPPGVYYLQLYNDDRMLGQKVVIER